jgi:DNA-binding LytR/AlgR family response regulator
MSKGALFLPTETGCRYAVVEIAGIHYLSAKPGRTTLIGTTEGPVHASLPLDFFDKTLSTALFCRIHESHIVALDKIISFDRSALYLPGATLPIGRNYLSQLHARIPILEESHWFINNEGRLEQGTGELL